MPTTLTVGDIAIVAYQADNTGGSLGREFFQFVLLTPVTVGTAIYFTDAGYRTDTGKWNATGGAGGTSTEGVVRWTAQADLPAGTVLTYLGGAGNSTASTTEWQFLDAATGATISTNNVSLANTGDSIYAIVNPTFGGTDNLGGTAITALFWGVSSVTGDGFDPTYPTAQPTIGTALAPGLTDGVNALAMSRIGGAGGTITGNGRYNDAAAGSVEAGTPAQILASIMNEANWTRSEAGVPVSPVSGHMTGTFNVAGPTTLAAGDIAFSAYQGLGEGGSYNRDAFEFVLLVPVTAGTTIYFTDGGFQTTNSRFRTNEGLLRWVAQSDLAAGTIVTFLGNPSNPASTFTNTPEFTGLNPVDGSVVTTGTFNFQSSGDSIHAFQDPVFGGAEALGGRAIAAIWVGGNQPTFLSSYDSAGSPADTALANGLTDGVNALSIGLGAPNGNATPNGNAAGRYNENTVGSIEIGTAAQLRASLFNEANWLTAGSQANLMFNPGGHTAGTFAIGSPLPTVSINTVSGPESSSLTFTVSLSAVSTETVTVNYATAGGTATSGTDFTAASGTVTFLPGETDKPVTVIITDDGVYEGPEDFTVVLSAPTNATIDTGTGTGTINASDTPPEFNFSSSSYSIVEGNAGTGLMTFTVTKTGATELASSVNYATSNGTAAAGSDYVATSGTLNFAAGETSKTFTVTINGDTTAEASEAFTVTLSSPNFAMLGTTSTATGTITNDDNAAPTATNLSASESYTEDTPRDLTDIVITDNDSANVTATLTLSVPSAGTLSTGNSGAVTSTYVAGTGVWTASGATADVNALLAAVTFNPAANFNGGLNIATSVSDGTSTITGTKVLTGVPVNDPPSGANATLTILEDGVSTLTAANFGFTDPNDSPSNALLAVRITTLPLAGSLTLNNVAVIANQSISVADINGGLLQFRPAANANGSGYSSFTFQVQDNGGTANSGVDLDPSANTLTFDVTAVNDAPTATDLSAAESYSEDTPLNLTDIVITDIDSASVTATLTLSNAAAGTLTTGTSNSVTSTFVGGVWTASGAVADVNALLAGVTFNPAANFFGSFNITTSVSDGVAAALTGVKAFTGTSVNDAPSGSDATLTILEDTPRSFTAADFGFSDVSDSPANALLGVVITTLPTAGTLTLDGFGLSVGQVVPVADIPDLVFTPALNANGSGYSSFTFQVQDNGGTANSGVDLDPSANTLTFDVTAVNDAPTATDLSAAESYSEDTPLNLTDIVITDIDSASVTATLTLSNAAAGTLTTGTSNSVTSTFVGGVWTASGAVADVNALLAGVTFNPAANFFGSFNITTSVSDGVAAALTGVKAFTGTSVNDAPSGSDATLTILEDTPRSFTAADFGFSDVSDSPANALLGVVITTLPTAGTLTLDGFGLSVGQVVPVADIPDLVFTPALNANGTGYATFTFQVQDNGGTADSGVDLDPSANTLTFNVTSVNDAPAGTNANQSVVEGTSRVLTLADFGFTDVDGNNFAAIRVSALPGAGRLTFDADGTGPGAPVSATVGQIVTVADIMAGRLAYETPSGANNGATNFSFQVQDDGGTLNGGVDLDASANTITYTITPATPPGPPPPVTIGNTTYVSGDYVQPANDPATVITPRNQSDNIALNITGNAGTQTIIGNYGPNILTGGGGADTLIGLINNDTYIVSNSNTVVVENRSEGTDTVLTSVSYILPSDAEIEFLQALNATGTDPIFLTGNAGNQRITGNAGDNIINGLGGSDTMVGLGGNDTYLVRGPGDVVVENNAGGFDTVYTTVSYNLGDNEVEVLSTVTQTDTTPINLIGNFVSQYVVGNYGDNLLNGGSGVDTLIGLFGNDLYAVGDSRIVIIEADGQGTDTVVTSVNYTLGADVSVEVLAAQIRSSTTGLALTGNAFGQTIAGTEGADTINGGAGSDVLIGGGGADRFDFTTLLGSSNVDAITDFGAGDRIGLSSAIFGAIGGTLDAGEFVIGTAAADADDRIVYDQATGQLFYDADGNGGAAAVLFAVVTPGTILSSSNFDVIAP